MRDGGSMVVDVDTEEMVVVDVVDVDVVVDVDMEWNILPQHEIKEQHNALVMNKKIMSILAKRDAAVRERGQALSTKKEALAARDQALQQRDKALTERDRALIERDNAFAALQDHENSLNFALSGEML
ncbi:hypothetical protein Bca52824_078631 [Brassica carinata]|uniref:GAGA-binding transcriptional activator n=1 Tax=Brassica carinata TaxID=52824 RepID=A0A8X7TYM4_BRACI|nr:hypothetical protein Bca52824_078631 [Brassica carinata]